ncbi:MAG: hypothetical protein Rsou_1164 [Candidatus Ruthia sp. Asou_11_S2]|nr:hypothetical protein [Candidatus Ruthia sp. Asou_11_S2]
MLIEYVLYCLKVMKIARNMAKITPHSKFNIVKVFLSENTTIPSKKLRL